MVGLASHPGLNATTLATNAALPVLCQPAVTGLPHLWRPGLAWVAVYLALASLVDQVKCLRTESITMRPLSLRKSCSSPVRVGRT